MHHASSKAWGSPNPDPAPIHLFARLGVLTPHTKCHLHHGVCEIHTRREDPKKKSRLKKWLLRTGLSTVIIGRITCWWCGEDYLGKNVGGNGDISLPKSKETAISKTVYVVSDVFDLWKCIANKDSLLQLVSGSQHPATHVCQGFLC